jgi:hypothetical protein
LVDMPRESCVLHAAITYVLALLVAVLVGCEDARIEFECRLVGASGVGYEVAGDFEIVVHGFDYSTLWETFRQLRNATGMSIFSCTRSAGQCVTLIHDPVCRKRTVCGDMSSYGGEVISAS